jgi:uncharacterized protein YjbJ (UPF0337 family)
MRCERDAVRGRSSVCTDSLTILSKEAHCCAGICASAEHFLNHPGTLPDLRRWWRKADAASVSVTEEENTMNRDQIEGNWEQLKGKAQSQWGKLTGDDLDVVQGRRKELAGKIQERYGKSREEAEREIDEWITRQ